MFDLTHVPSVAPLPEEALQLADDGFLVLEDVLDHRVAAELALRLDGLLAAEGEAAGAEFRQLVPPHERTGTDYLGNVVGKDALFRACVGDARVVGVVRHVLGDDIRVHAINSRSPRGGHGQQVLHAHAGLCNTLWLLDDMTLENGPTRVIPGSHRFPDEDDGNEDGRDWTAPYPGERLITAPAGAVLVLDPGVWHGGTSNVSGVPRRVITTAFSGPEIAPQYDLTSTVAS
jgi:ectoine hydroxylase-related dioxygenase (phytanoyl-CoA dioxygenase family)